MIRHLFAHVILVGSVVAATAGFSNLAAQAPVAPPPTCVRNVSFGGGGEDDARYTLLLRGGRIAAVLAPETEVPPGMRIVEGEGLLARPAFLDAFATKGLEVPEATPDRDVGFDADAGALADMRAANRKGIRPTFRAVEALALDEVSAWLDAGFGTALVAPGGELLAGTSALVTTREAAARDVVLRPDVFAHAAFRTSGRGYPQTLMAQIAQLRQFFLDVQWHVERVARYDAGQPGIRPPWDRELAAGFALLDQQHMLVCEADGHRDVERWLRLADDLDLEVAISGGRDAWRVADVLAARGTPILLTLDWGKEVKDPRPEEEEQEDAGEAEEEPEEEAGYVEVWEYEEPLAVRIDRRLRWEETRDCAIRLHEAGVRFAFGSGRDKPAELVKKVRELVEAGLPAEVAAAALTTTAAELLGVPDRLGRLETGYDATLVLWTADPLTDAKAKPAWVFVDGHATEYELEEDAPEVDEGGEPVDVSGTWVAEASDQGSSKLVLVMAEDGSLTGKLHTQRPGGDEMVSDVTGRVRGSHVELESTIHADEVEIEVTGSLTVEGEGMEGVMRFKLPFTEEPMEREVTMSRGPGGASASFTEARSQGRS